MTTYTAYTRRGVKIERVLKSYTHAMFWARTEGARYGCAYIRQTSEKVDRVVWAVETVRRAAA